VALALMLLGAAPAMAQPGPITIAPVAVDDLKAVFGTVESLDQLMARARISGTVEGIMIDEGDRVERGQMIGTVVDARLDQQLAALDARVRALESQLAQAETDYQRARQLRQSGTIPQAALDDAQTQVNVVTAQLAAARAEREALREQRDQGAVLAPVNGRVLEVQTADGEVMMAGEALATIAEETFVLRLYLPERHARFIREGDPVLVGDSLMQAEADGLREGTIRQVYPRLDQGRVVADATVPGGLGDFFVGERVRVWVSAGTRQAVVIPRGYVFQRFGVDFVRLEDGRDVVVRTGREVPDSAVDTVEDGIEILSGLRPGDVIVPPPAAAGDAA
jgi:RND family efflux transporter MFP subunit